MDHESPVSADLVLVALSAPRSRPPPARPCRATRAGPPPGGPVRSIRKNNVLPGSGPTDLHYGKNGYVPYLGFKFRRVTVG